MSARREGMLRIQEGYSEGRGSLQQEKPLLTGSPRYYK